MQRPLSKHVEHHHGQPPQNPCYDFRGHSNNNNNRRLTGNDGNASTSVTMSTSTTMSTMHDGGSSSNNSSNNNISATQAAVANVEVQYVGKAIPGAQGKTYTIF